MVFVSPSWVPDIVSQIPAKTCIGDVVLNARRAERSSRPPLVDAATGQKCTTDELAERVDSLAAVLQKDLERSIDHSSEVPVVGILGYNSIDYLVVCWAVHRIGGTCLLIQPTTSTPEIVSHMEKVKCGTFFVCKELLQTCKAVFDQLSSRPQKVYTLDGNSSFQEAIGVDVETFPQLLARGHALPKLEHAWAYKGETHNEIAFLLPTSGTSGEQKLARITHSNIIANAVQLVTFERHVKSERAHVALGILPLSHGFGLVLTHAELLDGGTVVLHATFNMQWVLKSIQQHQIERLYLVPPAVAALANNPILFKLFDLSSVREIVMGASACSDSLSEKMYSLAPTWKILAGYGLTECVSPIALTPSTDVMRGASGVLLPSVEVRLVDVNGKDVEEHEKRGEVYIRSPTLIPGYVGEDNKDEDFTVQGWLPTGDVGFFRVGKDLNEHLFIVDRVKDLIKVKGLQVSPSTIENVLRMHPSITDAAIVGVADDMAGERPLAFLIASKEDMTKEEFLQLLQEVEQHLQAHLDESHWLRRKAFFVNEFPMTAARKVLKRKLRDAVRRYDLESASVGAHLEVEW